MEKPLSRNDRERADTFVRHLQPLQSALEAYCRRVLRDNNDVEDALQSAIANAFRDFHLYAEGSNFRAWIFRYLNLEICNRNRKTGRHPRHELPADLTVEEAWQLALDEPLYQVLLDDPEAVLEQCDDRVRAVIHELPYNEQASFLLRVIGEFKYREIAQILEVPIGSVMGYLARSRLRLRQQLIQYGEELGLLKRP